jgi:integrase
MSSEIRKGKAPVWSHEDAKTLLDLIPKDSVSGLRHLALIAAMFYSFARVSAVLKLKVDDYYYNGARRRLRLPGKGGKEHDMPVRPFRKFCGKVTTTLLVQRYSDNVF